MLLRCFSDCQDAHQCYGEGDGQLEALVLVVRLLLRFDFGGRLLSVRLYPRVLRVGAVALRARILFFFDFPAPVFRLTTAPPRVVVPMIPPC
jgi:hypothetical protein